MAPTNDGGNLAHDFSGSQPRQQDEPEHVAEQSGVRNDHDVPLLGELMNRVADEHTHFVAGKVVRPLRHSR